MDGHDYYWAAMGVDKKVEKHLVVLCDHFSRLDECHEDGLIIKEVVDYATKALELDADKSYAFIKDVVAEKAISRVKLGEMTKDFVLKNALTNR